MSIVHDPPQDLAPWLEGKPEALRRRFGRFQRFCHLMSDVPGEAGTQELMAFARSIGQKDEWIQHRGAPAEHYDLFDGAIGRAARAGARQVDRAEMAAIMTRRRIAMKGESRQRQEESACSYERTSDGVQIFACRRTTTAPGYSSAHPDTRPRTAKQPLRAITLYAPWAWAFCHLGKPVENRGWDKQWKNGAPSYLINAPLALHAGHRRMWNEDVWWNVESVMRSANATPDHTITDLVETMMSPHQLAEADRFCSSIVAVAIIDRIERPLPGEPRMIGWRVSSEWGIYTRDLVVLPEPVPVDRGQLGLWTVPESVTEKVREQYRAALTSSRSRPLPEGSQHRVSSTEQAEPISGKVQLQMFGGRGRWERTTGSLKREQTPGDDSSM